MTTQKMKTKERKNDDASIHPLLTCASFTYDFGRSNALLVKTTGGNASSRSFPREYLKCDTFSQENWIQFIALKNAS